MYERTLICNVDPDATLLRCYDEGAGDAGTTAAAALRQLTGVPCGGLPAGGSGGSGAAQVHYGPSPFPLIEEFICSVCTEVGEWVGGQVDNRPDRKGMPRGAAPVAALVHVGVDGNLMASITLCPLSRATQLRLKFISVPELLTHAALHCVLCRAAARALCAPGRCWTAAACCCSTCAATAGVATWGGRTSPMAYSMWWTCSRGGGAKGACEGALHYPASLGQMHQGWRGPKGGKGEAHAARAVLLKGQPCSTRSTGAMTPSAAATAPR